MLRGRHRAPGLWGERFQNQHAPFSIPPLFPPITVLSIYSHVRYHIITFVIEYFYNIVDILRTAGSSGRAVCRQQGGVAVGHNPGSSRERSNGCPSRRGDAGREGGERFVRERHFREWGGHGVCGVDEERDGSDCASSQERDQRPKLASTFFRFLFGGHVQISDRPLLSYLCDYQVTKCTKKLTHDHDHQLIVLYFC